MNSKKETSPIITGSLLSVGGLLLIGSPVVLDPTLWLIPLRKIFVAFGAAFVSIGILIATTESRRPLDPLRSGIVPGAVFVALAVLLWSDLQRIDSLGVVLKPLQGFLLAASFGVPGGSALKQKRARWVLVSCGIGLAIVVGTILFLGGPSLRIPPLPVVALVVLGSLATACGYLLTDRTAR